MTLLSYLERRKILLDDRRIRPVHLRCQFLWPKKTTSRDLPRRVFKQTLERVKEACAAWDDLFSTQDIADAVGLSRISMRKYLNYMEETGLISGNLEYRSKGRPIYLYKNSHD